MAKEYIWVGKLDKAQKEIIFNPGEEDQDVAVNHSLLIKRVVLGPTKDNEDELNVVELETVGFMEDEIQATLCCLQSSKEKKFDQCYIDMLVSQGEIKFKLLQGSGPITIFGQHLAEFVEDDILSDEDEDDVDDVDLEMKKRKMIKAVSSVPRKMPKMDEDDDIDADFDEEDDIEEEKPKGKKPIPIAALKDGKGKKAKAANNSKK